MKRMVLFILTLLLLCTLVACEVSSYSALGLVRVTRENYCSASFARLDGKLVLNPNHSGEGESDIHYTASLEEGEINVYYKVAADVKELLFNIKAGDSIDARGGYIESGRQTIIIETVAPAKGEIIIRFD